MRNKRIGFVVTLIFLTACQERLHLAPVIAGSSTEKTHYVVQKGDTLFSIAWEYDKNYRELASINHLSQSSKLNIGQKLKLVSKNGRIKPRLRWTKSNKLNKAIKQHASKQAKQINHKSIRLAKKIQSVHKKQRKLRWLWPVKGRVVRKFAPAKHQKGIDIRSTKQRFVYASEGGQVAYSGDGLRGYGNLIIIKHSGGYLSAYAHNKKNWVKEGQWIKAHQKIAEMGSKGRQKGVLHFEIRYRGKPLDPLKMLSRR